MEKFMRYDPYIHSSASDYEQDYKYLSHNRYLSAHFALNGIFTPHIEEFRTQARALLHTSGLPELSGFEPLVDRYYLPTRKRELEQPGDLIHVDRLVSSLQPGEFEGIPIILPVSECYGENYAIALVETTRALFTVVSNSVYDTELSEGEAKVVRDNTFRDNFRASFAEAVHTTAAAIAFLTLDKVEGYEDPIELSQAVVSQGLVLELSTLLPTGVVVPFTIYGTKYQKPVVVRGGRLELSQDLKEYLASRKNNTKTDRLHTGLGCPLARANTPVVEDGVRRVIKTPGVQMMAEVFVEYLLKYASENC